MFRYRKDSDKILNNSGIKAKNYYLCSAKFHLVQP